MHLSRFGQKFCSESGIVTLMDDLGDALRSNPDMLFMGGGNPAAIPAMEQAFQAALNNCLADERETHQLFGVYQSPQGDLELLDHLAGLLSAEFGWPITRENIALSNGSQSAFFMLFNMFAGVMPNGEGKKILFPLAPEYLGYSDQGLSEDFFKAQRPSIELIGEHFFKYHVDFSALTITKDIGAICVSRPTNPTGNVISDEELAALDELAQQHNIPLIVDGAYGTPFPSILFAKANPSWNPNTVLVLSLSKLGLPGARTGIVIANKEIVSAFAKVNTILNLAGGNFGAALAKQLVKSGEILALSHNVVAPFYRQKMEQAVEIFIETLEGLPFRIHKPEGAIFLWLWFEGLPITNQMLYQRLKARGLLIISGHHFFMGLDEPWQHSHECIRITYCQDEAVIRRGAALIAEEVKAAFSRQD